MFGFLKNKFQQFRALLAKTGIALGSKIKSLLGKRDDSAFESLEELFYEADLGPTTSMELVESVRKLIKKSPDLPTEKILEELRSELLPVFLSTEHLQPKTTPHVIMIAGVNGSGKTTSIAKIAKNYAKQGKKVLLVAADTFRAAAIEQLEMWAKRLKIDIIKAQPKSDPSSVVFDALEAARARGCDIVLIDTAGRLQTKTDLMYELEKIRRVCKKHIPEAPHETLLVLDATTGQNALDQAKTFHEYTPIDGIVLSKLDGSAKGGIVVAIQKQLKIPVRWIGVGESADDLIPFDAEAFLDELLAIK